MAAVISNFFKLTKRQKSSAWYGCIRFILPISYAKTSYKLCQDFLQPTSSFKIGIDSLIFQWDKYVNVFGSNFWIKQTLVPFSIFIWLPLIYQQCLLTLSKLFADVSQFQQKNKIKTQILYQSDKYIFKYIKDSINQFGKKLYFFLLEKIKLRKLIYSQTKLWFLRFGKRVLLR